MKGKGETMTEQPKRVGPFDVSDDGVYEHMGDEYKGGVWLWTEPDMQKRQQLAVLNERERCAAILDAECERVRARLMPETTQLGEAVNIHMKTLIALLPELAADIRKEPT
jgi:hypothetical protein